jgi:pyruvate formate lyase activating enzyme
MKKESSFYKIIDKKKKIVQCIACNHYCTLKDQEKGRCGVRQNINGKLYSLVYGKPISISKDPIEKKPIFNFLPSTYSLSFGTYGCNFSCKFCQNYTISNEFNIDDLNNYEIFEPKDIVELAIKNHCPSISYTYNEPTVFCDYALQVMKLAHKKALKNIWVTNAYFSKELRSKIVPYLDAANIDYKGSQDFYKQLVGKTVDLSKIKENIKYLYNKNIHIELTYLLLEDHNTSKEDISSFLDFVESIDSSIPIHFTRSFPYYKLLDLKATTKETFNKIEKILQKRDLKNVYFGNI